jgi:Siphovirus protein of unknown function (DUF859)
MALSGSFYTNVNSHWRLRLDWSATQNIAGNYSTVTAKLYWIGLDSYGTTYSSATKDGAITINNSSGTFSGSGLAKLSGAQTKLIGSRTVNVYHESDGKKTFSLSAYFDAELTLSGTYYGRINVSGTATLNTIPRASTLGATSQASWTAGNNASFGISRASSTFSHELEISVKNTAGAWDWVKRVTMSTSETSKSSSFTTAENTEIFNLLAGRASAETRVQVQTFSGSTLIGTKDVYGTVTAPNASITSTDFDHYVYVDQTIDVGITRYHSSFTHTVRMKLGSFTKTITGVGTSTSWTPTATEQNSLYAQMPNDEYLSGSIEIDTFYNGVKVRSTTSALLQFYVRDAKPIFDVSSIHYYDTNANTLAITGDNQSIIQAVSYVDVSIDAIDKAVAQKGASMVSYIVTLNGLQKSANYSSTANVYFGMGTVQSAVDVVLSVKAVDSRGLYTEVTKTVKVIPYSIPKVISTAKRKNNFEVESVVALNGSISPVKVGGVQKNAITQAKFRYKIKTEAWSTSHPYLDFAYTTLAETFTATDKILQLNNTLAYDVEVVVADKLSSRTLLLSVSSGKPIFFIDSKKRSVGVNKFPDGSNTFEVEGDVDATGKVKATNGIETMYIYGKYNNSMPIYEDFMNGNASINAMGGRLYIGQKNTELVYHNADFYSLVTWGKTMGRDGKWYGEIDNEYRIMASLQNGWVNYTASTSITSTSGYNNAGYWKDKNGVVHITGLIKSGTNTGGTTLFTLPSGYRPYGTELFVQHSDNGNQQVRVDVRNTGLVTIQETSGSWVSLAGISFKAER